MPASFRAAFAAPTFEERHGRFGIVSSSDEEGTFCVFRWSNGDTIEDNVTITQARRIVAAQQRMDAAFANACAAVDARCLTGPSDQLARGEA